MKVEIRNDSVHIEGYVNVVERDSRVLPSPRGKFIEQVKAKTFQRALDSADNVDLLFNHDPNRKLGSTHEGMQLWEDDIGLRAIVDINDPEVVQKAKNKELTGWSFAFTTIKDRWEEGNDGIQRRYLEEITLPEVSLLSITPAYIATSIELRDDQSAVTEYRNTTIERVVVVEELEEHQDETSLEPIDYRTYEYEIAILKLKHRHN